MRKCLHKSGIFSKFALVKLKQINVMKYYKKADFIKEYETKVKTYKEYIKVIESLINSDLVKSYDGKQITKRFTDKVQAILPENIRIDLHTNWDNISFRLWDKNIPWTNNYVIISQYRNDKNSPMYLGTDRKFNHTDFLISAKREIEILKDWIKDWEESIERIDEVQHKYALLEKYIEELQKDVPLSLRVYINFRNPICD